MDSRGDCATYAPSVTDLAVRPDLYDGLGVQLTGFLSTAHEDRFVYASREDYEYGNQSAGVPLKLTAEQEARYRSLQGRRVRLHGRVKNGELIDISSAQVQELTRTEYNRLPALPPPRK